MASNISIFEDAEKARDNITESQTKEIQKLYEEWADEIAERAKYYSHKPIPSAVVSERQMKELYKQIKATSQEVSNQLYKKVKGNIYTVADETVKSNAQWLASLGFSNQSLDMAFSHVPDSIVRNLITGQIYNNGWNLSARIWSDNEQTLGDIYRIMAKGVAENRPIYEIAKELETYVRPSAKKSWNPPLATKNTKTGEIEYKRIYKSKVDYSAQRLARTLVQHGYQQSFLAVTQNNPFIIEYIWRSNGSRACQLCLSRDGAHFKKTELPMDHPNGMCTMVPVVVEDIEQQLVDWFNSEDGTYPEIDKFAKNFGYTPNVSNGVATKLQEVRSYTAKQIENASKFIKEFGMSKDAKKEYLETLQGTNREFQNSFVDAMKKKVKKWERDDIESYYNPGFHKICIDSDALDCWDSNLSNISSTYIKQQMLQKRQTLFHEIGHAIDDLAPGTGSAYSKSAKYGFKDAMLKDMKTINEACKSGDKTFISGLREVIKDDSSKGIQDAISAMHCKGIGLKDTQSTVQIYWGHSQEYYERKNAANEAASELFANMCGAKADPKAQEYMEKYFPNASKTFEQIILEIGG